MKSNNKMILGLIALGGAVFYATRAKAEPYDFVKNEQLLDTRTPEQKAAEQAKLAAMVTPVIPNTGGATAATPAAAPGGGMAPSMAAVELLKKYVGFSPMPKKEPSGAIIIGYGHKVVAGDPVEWSDTSRSTTMTPLTAAQGEALFLNDLVNHVVEINTNVKVPLNQNQYDALAMLVYNIGIGAFKTSTLLKRLNEKDYAGAAEQFLVWNKSLDALNNLIVNPVLTERRVGERALFLKSVISEPEVARFAQTKADAEKGLADMAKGIRSDEAINYAAILSANGAFPIFGNISNRGYNNMVKDLRENIAHNATNITLKTKEEYEAM